MVLGISIAWMLLGQGQGDFSVPNLRECDDLKYEADTALCGADSCILEGSVFLECMGSKLWADRVDLLLDETQQPVGGVARGNVILVDGDRRLRCEEATLDGDEDWTVVEDAFLEIMAEPGQGGVDATSATASRQRRLWTIEGSYERHPDGDMWIYDGSLTPCDCGEDPPSWVLTSPRIRIRNDRATLYKPRIFSHPNPRYRLQLTPALFPASFPLESRASGFLPPRVQGFGGLPAFDFPFFMPLGESHDLTLIPGVLTDWMAPRQGGRWRYHTREETEGQLRWSHTWDVGAEADLVGDEAIAQRYQMEWGHHARHGAFTNNLALNFVSDDAYYRDFQLSPGERTRGYLPSRHRLSADKSWGSLWIETTYLQRLGNGAGADPSVRNDVNWFANEVQRGPALRGESGNLRLLSVLPLFGRIGGGWMSAGAWGASPDRNELRLSTSDVWAGLSLAQPLGGTALQIDTTYHALGQSSLIEDEEQTGDVQLLHTKASLSQLWVSPAGKHRVRPAIRYAGLAPHRQSASYRVAKGYIPGARNEDLPRLNCGDRPGVCWFQFDPRHSVRRFDQLAAELDQEWVFSPDASFKKAGLGARQTLTVEDWSTYPLETWASLSAGRSLGLSSTSWWSFAEDEAQAFRGAAVRLRSRFGKFGADLGWRQIAFGSSLFVASPYALVGEGGPYRVIDRPDWTNVLTPQVSYEDSLLSLSYRPAIRLESPGDRRALIEAAQRDQEDECDAEDPGCDPTNDDAGTSLSADLFEDDDQRFPYIRDHVFRISYRSPCHCWGLEARANIPGEQRSNRPATFGISLTLADYSLGFQE